MGGKGVLEDGLDRGGAIRGRDGEEEEEEEDEEVVVERVIVAGVIDCCLRFNRNE